ncbi:MAG: hypothetical protein ABJH72_04415 [Reichenbachiella sp.]|uniref:hypothetical protein n=1 Tax=Reichenbachiella sp. TaxID=2184521 RepID=UPI003262DFD3
MESKSRFFGHVWLAITFFFLNCSGNSLGLSEIPALENDPLIESYKGKGIRMQLSYNELSPNLRDTLLFDLKGRIEIASDNFSTKEYKYDSIGNLTRMMLNHDTPSNYYLEYYKEGNSVIQNWNWIKHMRWEFTTEDLDSADRVIKFLFDDNGKIQEETNLNNGAVTKYKYENEKIIAKQAFDKGADVPKQRWNFEYSKNGTLIKAKYFSREELIVEDFLGDDGLLDSTRRNNYTLKYEYEFYK